MNHNETSESWKKFLNPITLKNNLILASVYIAVFENFKISLIERIKDFYCVSLPITRSETLNYKRKVLILDPKRHPFNASCRWLLNHGAISNEDISLLKKLRIHRNELAHELPKYISHSEKEIDSDKLFLMVGIIKKIDVWWIRNIDPPFDENLEEIDLNGVSDEEIIGGNSLFSDLLVRVLYNEKFLECLYKDFESRVSK